MFGKLLILFVSVPLIEFLLFAKIGNYIGFPATIASIIITGILGSWLAKKEGSHVISKFRLATSSGQLPHNEIIDGVLILIAGAVLLTPGFLTDAVGFTLLIPPARGFIRNKLTEYLRGRINIVATGMPNVTEANKTIKETSVTQGEVIDVDVVEH